MNTYTGSKDTRTTVTMDLIESCYPATRQPAPPIHMSSIAAPLAEQDVKFNEQQKYENLLSTSPLHEDSSRPPCAYENTISSPLSPLLIQTELDSEAARLLNSDDLLLDESPMSPRLSNSPTEEDLLTESSPELHRLAHSISAQSYESRNYREKQSSDPRDRSRGMPAKDSSDDHSSDLRKRCLPNDSGSSIPRRSPSLSPDDFDDSMESPDPFHDLPLPSRSSLTLSSSRGGAPLDDLPEEEEENGTDESQRDDFDPFEALRAGDYEPPAVGVAYQVTTLPEVLSLPQRRQLEQRNRTLEPTLVFQPPLDPEVVYGSRMYSPITPTPEGSQLIDVTKADFERMLKKVKEMMPLIPEDRFLQVYFEHDYDDLDSIAYAVKHQQELIFHTRESFTPLEKTLFETGLRQFGKNFREIQKLIKSKTLEEVMTFYFYWRATSRTEFLHFMELQLPNVRELHRARAQLVLQRLQREGKDPGLMKFRVDVDSDWMRNDLYPYTPEHDGAYIRVKNGNRMRDLSSTSSLCKRSPPYPSSGPAMKRTRNL